MSTSLIVQQTSKLASLFDIPDTGELVSVLKNTAFKGPVSDAQMSALLIVANQYGLNPWTKEIYAFPDRQNGIVPVVGVDGWSRIINSHPAFDGMDFEQNDESCTCRIYRKDRNHPISVTEWMSECRRENVGPWKSHPKRMLRHKAMIQCARLAFGFAGIYDQDEAERIAEKDMGRAVVEPVRDAEYQAFEDEHLPTLRTAAMSGAAGLQAAFASVPRGSHKNTLWQSHGKALKDAAAQADQPRTIEGEAEEVA